MVVVKRAQKTIDEASGFLSRLYGADNANLWYRSDPDDELYTSIKPDYRQTLKRKYAEQLKKLVRVDARVQKLESDIAEIQEGLRDTIDLAERDAIIARKVAAARELDALREEREGLSDSLVATDVDIVQAAFDDHDMAVSLRRKGLSPTVFKQAWNERIVNAYERDRLQYLTSDEKTRYFEDKVRALKKVDPRGLLDHEDWFFRVVVLDLVVQKMQKLVQLFKQCSWNDFETVYRVVRKLRLLLLDAESTYCSGAFDINRTNLFYISDEFAKSFTRIDDLLDGSTFYDLFKSQVALQTDGSEEGEEEAQPEPEKDKEVLQEQASEEDLARRRRVRYDVIVRMWGSEEALTKAAYESTCTEDDGEPITVSLDG